MGGWDGVGVGVGGGWEAEGRLNHPLAQGKSHCVFNKACGAHGCVLFPVCVLLFMIINVKVPCDSVAVLSKALNCFIQSAMRTGPANQ